MQTQSQDVQKPHSLARRLRKKRKQEWIIEEILLTHHLYLELKLGKSVLLYRMAASMGCGEDLLVLLESSDRKI